MHMYYPPTPKEVEPLTKKCTCGEKVELRYPDLAHSKLCKCGRQVKFRVEVVRVG